LSKPLGFTGFPVYREQKGHGSIQMPQTIIHQFNLGVWGQDKITTKTLPHFPRGAMQNRGTI
jgi:hypothetical protein